MGDIKRNSGSVGSGSVTKASFSFTNTIENYVGRASNGETHSITKQDVIDFDIELAEVEEPEKFANAVGAKQVSGFMSFLSGIVNFVDEALSTAAVLVTSSTSGAVDLVEHVVDGAAWAVSTVGTALGADTTGIKEFIARDLVDEANEWFYEKTDLGRHINDSSAVKYDSDLAQGVRHGTEKAAVIVAATAATVCTGGAASVTLPLVLGFAYGSGEKAEQTYQVKGTNTTLADELSIGLAGVGGAVSWYSMGKLGQGALTAFKAVKAYGFKNAGAKLIEAFSSLVHKSPKEIGQSMVHLFRGVFNKTNLTRALSKSLRDVDNIFESVGIIADDVTRWINGDEEFNARSVMNACGELGLTWIGNVTFSAVGEYFVKEKRIADIPGMSDSQRETLDDIFETEHEIARGDYVDSFGTYREHAELHTQAVRDYAVMLGLDIDTLDDRALAEIYYGAYFHDLGMAGGGVDAAGMTYGLNYDKGTHQFVGFLDDIDESCVKLDSTLSATVGNTARGNHPLNSAMSVLTTDIVPEGLDRDKIALLALSHSKSTSGVTSFADPDQWRAAIDQLDDAVSQYNLRNGLTGADAITFDADRLRSMVSDPGGSEFRELVDQAVCIRDGDAMSNLALTSDGHTLMQTGNVAHVDSPSLSYDFPISESDELAGVTDVIKTPEGETLFTVDDAMGKKFHAGEENVNFDSVFDGHSYSGRVELVDPHKVPNSSIFNIEERLGEVVTYTNCDSRLFTIELPSDMIGTPMGNMYVTELEEFSLKEIDKAFAKLQAGKITQTQFDAIRVFYEHEVSIPGTDFSVVWEGK